MLSWCVLLHLYIVFFAHINAIIVITSFAIYFANCLQVQFFSADSVRSVLVCQQRGLLYSPNIVDICIYLNNILVKVGDCVGFCVCRRMMLIVPCGAGVLCGCWCCADCAQLSVFFCLDSPV